ncbi:hypothetical protein [Corynebacterium sp. H130]|uniref:hypothetical protein n=1 Tax=Corynebacterium sp. H130 TaxID=3133444 RepID=UPI00309DFFA4
MTNPFGSPGQYPQGDQNAYQQNPYGQPQNQGYQQGYQQQGYQQFQPQNPYAFDAMNSMTQGWRVFKENPMPWIVGALVWGGIGFVIFIIGYIPLIMALVESSQTYSDEFPLGAFMIFMMFALVAVAAWSVGYAVMSKVSVKAVAGSPVTVGDFFQFQGVGKVIGVAILVQLVVQVGNFFLVAGIVASFLFYFAIVAAAARPNDDIMAAFKISFEIATKNFVQTLLLMILASIVMMVGSFVLLIGMVAAFPVMIIGLTHAFQTATKGPVQNRAQ